MTERPADLPIVFSNEDVVRDSEVDMHGGVNNPVYLVYAQANRHMYLRSIGINVDKIMPVVTEAHLKYVGYLGPTDNYRCDLRVYREKLAYHFLCDITNTKTGKLSFTSDLKVVMYEDRRPVRADIVGEHQSRTTNS